MGFFDIFRRVDINEGVKSYKAAEGAVLIDVRTLSEYAGGHIEGSVNIKRIRRRSYRRQRKHTFAIDKRVEGASRGQMRADLRILPERRAQQASRAYSEAKRLCFRQRYRGHSGL